METIILIVSFIGCIVSDIDFITLYFYIDLTFTLWKVSKQLTNDENTNIGK